MPPWASPLWLRPPRLGHRAPVRTGGHGHCEVLDGGPGPGEAEERVPMDMARCFPGRGPSAPRPRCGL